MIWASGRGFATHLFLPLDTPRQPTTVYSPGIQLDLVRVFFRTFWAGYGSLAYEEPAVSVDAPSTRTHSTNNVLIPSVDYVAPNNAAKSSESNPDYCIGLREGEAGMGRGLSLGSSIRTTGIALHRTLCGVGHPLSLLWAVHCGWMNDDI
ncbi:hypothetical protein BDQ17DRAFT_1372301 [Cyathus striatus]|nr:hypothetical protein BDQ17DRAFT_1372301 [Cyathus striatus]